MEDVQKQAVVIAPVNLASHEEAMIGEALNSINAKSGMTTEYVLTQGGNAKGADIIVASMNSPNLDNTHQLFQRVYNVKSTIFLLRTPDISQKSEYKYTLQAEDLDMNFTRLLSTISRNELGIVIEAEHSPPVPEDESPTETFIGKAPKTSNGKVLIVDDSVSLRTKLAQFLDKRNFDCTQANDAEEAMQVLQDELFDIIFMDILMPGADGYQACKAIKSLEDMKEIPVILLSSMNAPADKIRGVMSGCDKYLTKPVRGSELDILLKSYFSEYVPPVRKSNSGEK